MFRTCEILLTCSIRHDVAWLVGVDSDPSGPVNPVNSCIFVAVLYFVCGPVFSCIFIYYCFGCVYLFTLEVQRVFSIKRYLHQLVSVDCS